MVGEISKNWPTQPFDEINKTEAMWKIPFKSLCDAGLVYLLLDGLDEFALQPDSDIRGLMNRCKELSQLGVKVIIACRNWFWEQRMSDYKADFATAQILPFTVDHVKEFLGVPFFEQLNKNLVRGIPDWLRSPLILSFIRDSEFFQFTRKTELFSAWTRWISEVELKGAASEFSVDEVVSFYKELALLLAKERDQRIEKTTCEKANCVFSGGKKFTPLLPPTSKFLEPKKLTEESTITAKFFHHSLYEFFVAMRLADDFKKAIELSKNHPSLFTMAIANVDLDFFTATVYGFLFDVLGSEYEEILFKWLGNGDQLNDCPERLVRNLIEYIGMTSTNTDPSVARSLMEIVAKKALSEVIRYNAARALERIHPSAPRPHFDYMSDWGVADFGEIKGKLKTWAIRGVGRKERAPREFGMTFYIDKFRNRNHENRFPDIQKEICNELLNVIESLINSSEYIDLQLNCSHTLIRWHNRENNESKNRINNILKRGEVNNNVKDNLRYALTEPSPYK